MSDSNLHLCTVKYGAKIVIANKILFDAFAPLRHNKRKKQKMATERKGSTLPTTSDDSISTVLEEDEEEEELERTDSNDDGLQSLLDNYLGNSSEHDSSTSSAIMAGRGANYLTSSDTSSGGLPNRILPRSQYHCSKILASLDASNAPVELRQATALLLQSSLLDESTAKLLTSDILNQPLEGGGETLGETNVIGEEHQNVETTFGFEDTTNSSSVHEQGGYSEEASCSLGLPDDASTTTTALLRPATSVVDLRPSIFTMHSMSPPNE